MKKNTRFAFNAYLQQLAKYQIEAWQLIFEVTESNALTNVKQAQITLQHLQELGCQIAIDDFGTGYASYARLKNVNADLLKIDGSFIRNIVSNSLDYQIVASICHLARMKKMRVVAEYVENEEIREAVLSLGIDYMQGYLIGKPQPLIDTPTFLVGPQSIKRRFLVYFLLQFSTASQPRLPSILAPFPDQAVPAHSD